MSALPPKADTHRHADPFLVYIRTLSRTLLAAPHHSPRSGQAAISPWLRGISVLPCLSGRAAALARRWEARAGLFLAATDLRPCCFIAAPYITGKIIVNRTRPCASRPTPRTGTRGQGGIDRAQCR
jgi:hypothetical protein